MYESFYAFSANPFRLVPDAHFYYASSGHKRGLAYLRYGLHQGQGFVIVTGRPGTGKSTLVQTLFSELTDQQLIVSSITSTNLGAADILQAVGNSFDVYGDASNKASLLIGIENFLKAKARQGKRVILIVDEAHNLPQASLEELRMLSNFQLGDKSLLQIMLLGQHQLPEILAQPDMEQLSQRVIASCHLQPLSKDETRAYIGHRLQCVGWRGDPSISGEAVALVYAASTGIPRLINVFCDRMFLAASLDGKHDIDLQQAKAVLTELQQEATGTFSSVTLEIDDLIGLDPLPGDDFLLAPEPVSVVENDVQTDEDSGHDKVPDQVDEQHEEESFVVAVEDKPQVAASDFEPSFSSDTCADLTPDTTEQDQQLDDSDDIAHQKFEITEQLGNESTAEQVGLWKKRIVIIVLLAVVLVFVVVLFIIADDKKLPEDTRSDASSADVAAIQKPQTEFAQQFESLPVMTPDNQTELSTPLPDVENIIPAEAESIQSFEVEETGLDFEQLSLDNSDSLIVIAPPVAAEYSELIGEPAQSEILKSEPESEPVVNKTKVPAKIKHKNVVADKVDQPVVNKSAVPKQKAKQSKPEAKVVGESISDSELTTLVFDLINFYEKGDLDAFSALFAKDAVANGMNGVAKIRKDYKRLFSSTGKRQMSVDDMQWQHNPGRASGRGVFTVSVWKKVGLEPLLQQGILNIELIRNDGKLLITTLSHELN